MKTIHFKTVLLIFGMSINLSIYAQWQELSTSGMFGDNLFAIAKSDNKIFAASDTNGLYMSADAGVNWTKFVNGLPSDVFIKSLLTYKDTTVFAGVKGYGVYKYSRSKNAWSILSGGFALNVNADFLDLIISKDTLYAACSNATFYKTSLTHINWVQLPNTGNAYYYNSFHVVDDSLLVAGFSSNYGFYRYSRSLKTWVQENQGFPALTRIIDIVSVGNTIYAATNRGVYSTKAGVWNWNQNSTGLPHTYTGYVSTKSLKISGNKMYLSIYGGIYSSDIKEVLHWNYVAPYDVNSFYFDNTGIWTVGAGGVNYFNGSNWQCLNKGMNAVAINELTYSNEKLYALTSTGLYESVSGNGGDWKIKDFAGQNVTDYLEGEQMTIAISNTRLYKENEDDFEIVKYNGAGVDSIMDEGLSGFYSLLEVKHTSGTYYFAGMWNAQHGVYRTKNAGATWFQYNTFADTQNIDDVIDTIGLQREGSKGQRAIVNNLTYYKGILYSSGKNGIQMSKDLGDTWYWRNGDLAVRMSTSNIRKIFPRTYKNHDYLFIATDVVIGGLPCLSRSRSSSLGRHFELSNATGGFLNDDTAIIGIPTSMDIRSICQAGENNLWIVAGSNGVYKSEDNGYHFFDFNFGLNGAKDLRDQLHSPINGYLYLSKWHTKIFRYALDAPKFNNVPYISNIQPSDAKLTVNSTQTGRAYYVLLPAASPNPSASQVIAGKDASNHTALHGSFMVTYDTDYSTMIDSMSPAISYKLYVVIVNAAQKTSNVETISFLTTDLNNVSNQSGFRIVPNPTTGIFYLQREEATENAKIYIYANDGRLVKAVDESNLGITNYGIDISDLNTGGYVMRIVTREKVNVLKLIKE